MTKLFVFDLDGVLIDSLKNMETAWMAVKVEHGVKNPFSDYHEQIGRPFPEIMKALKNLNFSHIVMEVSSHSLDQYRVSDIEFNISLFTNLSPEHLDYHGTLERYYKAKSLLFKALSKDATAIINKDDLYLSLIHI